MEQAGLFLSYRVILHRMVQRLVGLCLRRPPMMYEFISCTSKVQTSYMLQSLVGPHIGPPMRHHVTRCSSFILITLKTENHITIHGLLLRVFGDCRCQGPEVEDRDHIWHLDGVPIHFGGWHHVLQEPRRPWTR